MRNVINFPISKQFCDYCSCQLIVVLIRLLTEFRKPAIISLKSFRWNNLMKENHQRFCQVVCLNKQDHSNFPYLQQAASSDTFFLSTDLLTHAPPNSKQPGNCLEASETSSSTTVVLDSDLVMTDNITTIWSVSKSFSPNNSFLELKSDTSKVVVPKVRLLHIGFLLVCSLNTLNFKATLHLCLLRHKKIPQMQYQDISHFTRPS